jgi:hypothetical protein
MMSVKLLLGGWCVALAAMSWILLVNIPQEETK